MCGMKYEPCSSVIYMFRKENTLLRLF